MSFIIPVIDIKNDEIRIINLGLVSVVFDLLAIEKPCERFSS